VVSMVRLPSANCGDAGLVYLTAMRGIGSMMESHRKVNATDLRTQDDVAGSHTLLSPSSISPRISMTCIRTVGMRVIYRQTRSCPRIGLPSTDL
jgi:hypothetical protein